MMTPDEVQLLAQKELQSGERLLWAGTGDPKRTALAMLPVSFFGIFFAGFAVFWMWGAAGGTRHAVKSSGPMMIFPLFGLPFLFIGLSIVAAPLWVYLRGLRTVYAVTDQRVMAVIDGRNRAVKSYAPGDILSVEHRERANGTGDLILQTKGILASNNNTTRPNSVILGGISDVMTVERLVMDLRKKQPET